MNRPLPAHRHRASTHSGPGMVGGGRASAVFASRRPSLGTHFPVCTSVTLTTRAARKPHPPSRVGLNALRVGPGPGRAPFVAERPRPGASIEHRDLGAPRPTTLPPRPSWARALYRRMAVPSPWRGVQIRDDHLSLGRTHTGGPASPLSPHPTAHPSSFRRRLFRPTRPHTGSRIALSGSLAWEYRAGLARPHSAELPPAHIRLR